MKASNARLPLAALVLLVSGCAAQTFYQPGTVGLSKSDVAEIYLPDPVHYGAVLEQVDGEWRGTGIKDRYLLLPGKRCITFALNKAYLTGTGKLIRCFNAEKGMVYSVTTSIGQERWDVSIVDYKTKKIVSKAE